MEVMKNAGISFGLDQFMHTRMLEDQQYCQS